MIPNDRGQVRTSPRLRGLENFEPKVSYPYREGMQMMKYTDPKTGKTRDRTQTEMGKITNLIADMQLLGAKPDEIAAAVRHSMVVIDAGKHKLDFKQSELDNNIAALRKKYQGSRTGGAGTYITRVFLFPGCLSDGCGRRARAVGSTQTRGVRSTWRLVEATSERSSTPMEPGRPPRTGSPPSARFPSWTWLTTLTSCRPVPVWRLCTRTTPMPSGVWRIEPADTR